jgi:hypothetical protein
MFIRHIADITVFLLYNTSSKYFSLRYTFNNHAGDFLPVPRSPTCKVYLTVILENAVKLYIKKTGNESIT